MSTTAERLQQAIEARHQLALGLAVVEVWDEDYRVTYKPTSPADLDDYIGRLEAKLAKETGDLCSSAVRRPLTFLF